MIAGIGAKREKALPHHSGPAQAVGRAGLAGLEAAEGISKALAQRICDHFRAGG